MIESFNIPTANVAKWAGLTSAVFSLSQASTGIAWGRASDRFGRKPAILTSLTCTMITSILFGFSRSLVWALLARAGAGLANGNVGIIRTCVAELVPQKVLQPRAFSVMPLVWTIGSILGPAFGGALVHPKERFPALFGRSTFFENYPFSLPNLVGSVFFLIGLTSGILFLQESLEAKKDRRDYGLKLGSALVASCSKRNRRHKHKSSLTHWRTASYDESAAFLEDDSENSSSSPMSQTPLSARSKPFVAAYKPPSYREVFSRQSNINLAVYTFLAMHSVAFDQLLPIFMHYPLQSRKDPDIHLPLKFAGGFGITSSRIGLLFTIYGVVGMFIQFAIFPPFARRFGVLNCLKACLLTFPLIYLCTPFTSLLPTSSSRQGFMMALMLVKCFCAIFSFPCSTILLTNSAVSLKILGTLNGVATSISALGRASGPALAGATFTAGVGKGYVITPWWTLAAVAILGTIPAFWLIEMEGFGGTGDSDSDDDDDSDGEPDGSDDVLEARADPALTATDVASRASPISVLAEEAVMDIAPQDAAATPLDSPFLNRWTSRGPQRRTSRPSFDLRRIPSPIGMGEGGVAPRGARRYSSDLGASRSGFGAGGTSYH